MLRKNNTEICDEFIIKRWGQGVKLMQPGVSHHLDESLCMVANVMRLPANFYFINPESTIIKLSERTVQTCGYVSASDAVGRSIREVSKAETAQKIIKNDREIINTEKFKIIFENYTRVDGVDLSAISIKFPWFGDDAIIGIFGCSILIEGEDFSPVAESVSLLMQAGLLTPSMTLPVTLVPSIKNDSVFLSDRDIDILYWLVRGNTAKGIAVKLGISHRTVEHRLEQIKLKFAVNTKSELIDRVIDLFIK